MQHFIKEWNSFCLNLNIFKPFNKTIKNPGISRFLRKGQKVSTCTMYHVPSSNDFWTTFIFNNILQILQKIWPWHVSHSTRYHVGHNRENIHLPTKTTFYNCLDINYNKTSTETFHNRNFSFITKLILHNVLKHMMKYNSACFVEKYPLIISLLNACFQFRKNLYTCVTAKC